MATELEIFPTETTSIEDAPRALAHVDGRVCTSPGAETPSTAVSGETGVGIPPVSLHRRRSTDYATLTVLSRGGILANWNPAAAPALIHVKDRFRWTIQTLGASAPYVAQARRLVTRNVVPVLVLLLIVESAWLARGAFRFDADDVGVVTSNVAGAAATSGVRTSRAEPRGEPIVESQSALPQRGISNDGRVPQKASAAADAAASPAGALRSVPAPGSVSVEAPFQIEVYENGRFVGMNDQQGLPLSAGSHSLELVNNSLGYRVVQTVTVNSGEMTQLGAMLPTGMLHLNATPWAEVFIDDRRVGETPLANIEVPIGPHTIVFRHPQLGEQVRKAVVSAQSSTRIGVNLGK